MVEIDPLPSRFLAELRPVGFMPFIYGRNFLGPGALSLFAGIVDVVVRLVILSDSLQSEIWRSVIRSESLDIHMPEIHRWLTRKHPFGNYLADSAGACNAMGTKTRSDIEATHGSLAKAELIVGSKTFRPIDEILYSDFCHLRDSLL